MSWQNNKLFLHLFITLPVTLVIVGAFSLSAAAVFENLRFIRSTNQIVTFVTMTRSMITQQSSFAQNPGDDVWVALEHAGQIEPAATHLNPWQGEMRATVLTAAAMRIENDLPTHDCRRLALYFMAHDPQGLGLLSIEAQGSHDTTWTAIYPFSTRAQGKAAESACGKDLFGRLALIFKLR